jgi:hypothetical protein
VPAARVAKGEIEADNTAIKKSIAEDSTAGIAVRAPFIWPPPLRITEDVRQVTEGNPVFPANLSNLSRAPVLFFLFQCH